MRADPKSDLARYEDAFAALNVGRARGHEKPHKPIMLLTVMDLIESGRLRDNRIEFEPDLLSLDGKHVIPPREARCLPKAEALRWRLEHLRRTA